MTPVRLALVGLGKIARDQHAPALAASPDFEVVCGASPEGRSPRGATYPSVEAMLAAEPGVQALAMCQPPQARFEAAGANSKLLPARPDNPTLLKIYGLYKQATQGDNTEKKPSFSDIVARAKWDAWNVHKGVSADDKVYTASDSLSTDADFDASDWSEAEVIWVQGL